MRVIQGFPLPLAPSCKGREDGKEDLSPRLLCRPCGAVSPVDLNDIVDSRLREPVAVVPF